MIFASCNSANILNIGSSGLATNIEFNQNIDTQTSKIVSSDSRNIMLEPGGTEGFEMGQNITVSGTRSVGINLHNASYTVSEDNTMAIMDGKVGIDVLDPDVELEVAGSIRTQKVRMTPEGGIAVLMTNRDGGTLNPGRVVEADSANDDSFKANDAGGDHPIGVVYEAVADNVEGWIVVAGIADIALEDNVAAVRGYWMGSSGSEAGYAETQANSPGFNSGHFEEIGHCIESVSAGGGGTHILARCIVHFD